MGLFRCRSGRGAGTQVRTISEPFRNPAYGAGAHLGFRPINQLDRTKHPRGVGERHRQGHCLSGDLSSEPGRVNDSSLDRIRVDVVGPGRFELAICVRVNRPDCVAQCATDVDVNIGVADDQASVVAAPRSGDFGDRGGVR